METYEIQKGTTFQITGQIDDSITGGDYPLTGSTLSFKVYEAPNQRTLVATGVVTIVDLDTGEITITLPGTATSGFTYTRVLCGVVALTKAGTPWTLQKFRLVISG